MKKSFRYSVLLLLFILAIGLFALSADAAPPPPGGDRLGLVLKARQSVGVTCLGDELIITPASNGRQAEVICRVWVR